MKEFIKKYSLGIAIIGSIIFLTIFLFFLFQKEGKTVYITAMTGKVSVGSSTDAGVAVEAFIGMELGEGDIVLTGDRASCVLSYDKKAGDKDNFITICQNSQVNLYSKNKQGGYNFFVTYGSIISNMTTQATYTTNVSSKLFTLSADGLITKIDYDMDEVLGNIYVFEGNGTLQIIQPSGTSGKTETLIKNSATAVRHMDDGTVGFGQLNCPFGLDSFSAQDLKIMSGVANNWSEKLSYNMSEFEQAFQTAYDYDDFMQIEPATMTTVTEALTSEVTMGTVSTALYTEIETEATTTKFMGATQTVPGMEITVAMTNKDGSANVVTSGETLAFSEFTRDTVTDLSGIFLREDDTPETATVATVPSSSESALDNSSTSRPRETGAYSKATTADGYVPAVTTAGGTNVTTTGAATTSVSGTTSKKIGTTVPATTKQQTITITTPAVKVDPNATHTVIFTYSEGGKDYWAIQVVKHGESAIAPTVPDISGKRFQKWDKDYSCVTSDMTITGIFADGSSSDNVYTVTLYVDNTVWKTITVKHGDDIVISSEPKVSGKTFSGWSSSLNNITSDKTVFALFVE